MAGQGMNMGINDAAILANTIIRNLKTGNDVGSA
jgi:2-polyprenyl-6-methoxyphenol hydroxylase-like FAD-dependent oxidoreductase